MKELIELINKTDTATTEELQQLYKEIISAWDALNK